LKGGGGSLERHAQVAANFGLECLGLESAQLEPHPQVHLHIDLIQPGGVLLAQFGALVSVQSHHLVPLEDGVQHVRGLVPLVEGIGVLGVEPGVVEQCTRLDEVVVDTQPLVRVAHCDVQGKIVVEGVVGVVELREGGVSDVEFHHVGTDYEPEDEHGDGHDDDQRENHLEDEAEDAAEEAAAAAAKPAAAPWAVVGLLRRNSGAVVGSVQLRHGRML